MMLLRTIIKSAFLVFLFAAAPLFVTLPSGLGGITQAHAAVISRIEVRGNRRMDADTIISYLTVSPGDNVTRYDIDASVKALFATELFSDVSIEQQVSVLIVVVDENATVNKVFFEGNNRLKDQALSANVKVQPQSIYSDEKAAYDVELIGIAYARVGRDDAEVTYEVVPLDNNRVNVIYRVNEGGKTKISEIIFVGNQTFSNRRLADIISTKRTNLLSFLGTSDIYDPNKVASDQELLRRFYFNKGFADFQIISVSADLNDDTNEYTLTFSMEEGPRYTFGDVAIESSIPGVSGDGLTHLIETVPGDNYSASKVEESIIAITERVAEEGYAFVEVVPRGNRNFETNTIDVTYLIDEGARVYIEDISILGNDRTRDYVIRREFDLSEGDAYNRVLIQKTRTRLERLGFFEKVDISTRPGSEPDKVIVVVRLTEKATGEFSLSGGYSTNGGPSAEISFSEKNFLGRGQFIRVSARQSEDEQSYGLSFSEPYFLGYRMSAGFNVSTTTSDSTSDRAYAVDTTGGNISFGIPLTEKLGASAFYAISGSDVTIAASLLEPSAIDADVIQGSAAGELSAALAPWAGSWLASGVGYSLTYVDLDNTSDPREGIYAKLSQTFYGVGGDASYLSTEATASAYHTLSEEADLVVFARARGGHIETFGGTTMRNGALVIDGFRTTDNFQSNTKAVRGFDSFGFGPRDPITGDALGGRTYWNGTAEVQFPLPFLSRSFGLRGAFFADAGMLFNLDPQAKALITTAGGGVTASALGDINDESIRASVGGSIIWASPFGPLRVDYAVPIASETYDDIREFNFGVSSKF